MKNLCIIMTVVFMGLFVIVYARKIIAGLRPTLATWISFGVGVAFSLITYAVAEEHDFASGILNTVDVFVVAAVIASILRWGSHEVHFSAFDRWYLLGLVLIIIYGLWSGNAWRSNIFTQFILVIGYTPMFKKMWTEKRNTESFSAWACNLAAGVCAFYPAISGGKGLAILYACRSLVMITVTLALMFHYQFGGKTNE